LPLLQDLEPALLQNQLGYAVLGADLVVLRRRGALSGWLPPEGEPACVSPLLAHMEETLLALRGGARELVLPSVRIAERQSARVTISAVWDEEDDVLVVLTTPDHGGDQINRLLASERREKLLLGQQAEAAAAQLRVADALYRDLVESAGDLVLRFGADGRIVFANRRAAEFLGLPQSALIGRPINSAFLPSGAENPWRLTAYAERPACFELATRGADGALRCFMWDVRFSGAESGGEFQAVGRDVTTQKRLQAERDKTREEARAAALSAQRLAIAHDLHDTLARSIVTLILEMGVIAKTTKDEKARAALDELQATARAGLAEARAAIVMLRAAPEGEDPKRIIAEFRLSAHKQGLEVVEDIKSEAASLPGPLAEAVARVLREALRNIELHACAKRVEINLVREGATLRLWIRDDGVGFDPMRSTPGHFGLIGMKERANLVGATLDVESAPGKGTTLTLSAPLAPPPA
jgi:PAS domain S-box-containing protein